MIIKKGLQKGTWYNLTDKAKFLIRDFPFTELSLLKSTELDNNFTISSKMSEYCLAGWEGLEDEDGAKFEYNKENKAYILNYYPEVREFIAEKISELKKVKTPNVKKTSKK